MCSARPAAVPPAWDPARRCIEGIELLKPLTFSKLAPPCGVPCRISIFRRFFFLFGRDRCLRLLKAINTKNEIIFTTLFKFKL
jgi:hypothetical protein